MKSNSWKDIAELIGISAIVASLIFVGLQMKQSQDIALAAQYQARAEAAQNMMMSMQESGMAISAIQKPAAEMNPAERYTIDNLFRWSWTQYDNMHFQYVAGFLDEESWKGQKARIERIYSRCDQRQLWENMRPFVRPSFVAYVDSLNDPCTSAN
jgi:hypothetical protein